MAREAGRNRLALYLYTDHHNHRCMYKLDNGDLLVPSIKDVLKFCYTYYLIAYKLGTVDEYEVTIRNDKVILLTDNLGALIIPADGSYQRLINPSWYD